MSQEQSSTSTSSFPTISNSTSRGAGFSMRRFMGCVAVGLIGMMRGAEAAMMPMMGGMGGGMPMPGMPMGGMPMGGMPMGGMPMGGMMDPSMMSMGMMGGMMPGMSPMGPMGPMGPMPMGGMYPTGYHWKRGRKRGLFGLMGRHHGHWAPTYGNPYGMPYGMPPMSGMMPGMPMNPMMNPMAMGPGMGPSPPMGGGQWMY